MNKKNKDDDEEEKEEEEEEEASWRCEPAGGRPAGAGGTTARPSGRSPPGPTRWRRFSGVSHGHARGRAAADRPHLGHWDAAPELEPVGAALLLLGRELVAVDLRHELLELQEEVPVYTHAAGSEEMPVYTHSGSVASQRDSQNVGDYTSTATAQNTAGLRTSVRFWDVHAFLSRFRVVLERRFPHLYWVPKSSSRRVCISSRSMAARYKSAAGINRLVRSCL